MKSREQVEDLKKKWTRDPSWDLEDTEGFEEHQGELLNFRLDMEQKWKKRDEDNLRQLAEKYGCPGNLRLSAFIERLDKRIQLLEKRIETLEEKLADAFVMPLSVLDSNDMVLCERR